MEPERRKEIIKTALLVAVVLLGALFLLDMVIGDPGAIPTPAEL